MKNNEYPPVQQIRSGSSLNGFVLGLVVGVLITLLFTTKKGRQILQTLTEEGMNKFNEVEDIIRAMEEDGEIVDPEEDMDEPLESEMPDKAAVEEKTPVEKVTHPVRHLPSGHKFFRKATKK